MDLGVFGFLGWFGILWVSGFGVSLGLGWMFMVWVVLVECWFFSLFFWGVLVDGGLELVGFVGWVVSVCLRFTW